MSERDGRRTATKRRRNRQTNNQDGAHAPALQRPAHDDKEAWKGFWKTQGQPWRTEPEIDTERHKYLDARRSIVPDIEHCIYPFKDIKLTRADVEWLLATHENGRGPVDWTDESQRERLGLDVRAAHLSQMDLHNLPLACLRGGLAVDEWSNATEEQRNAAAVLMERPNLYRAHLEGAYLGRAHLERANLSEAHLEHVYLGRAHLEGAYFWRAHLEYAYLGRAHLSKAILDEVILSDEKHIAPQVADIHWSDVNLAVVKWSQVDMLGDEYKARQKKAGEKVKGREVRLDEYEQAVRANRQLAVVLRDQGINEDATRFAYRAQLLQCKVLWYQRKFGQYFFSLFLDLLAGYGYKPWRSFVAYLVVIFAFAIAYFIIGRTVGPSLSPVGAWVFSMTSFHLSKVRYKNELKVRC